MWNFKIKSIEQPVGWALGVGAHLDSPDVASWGEARIQLSLAGWITSKFEEIESVSFEYAGKEIANGRLRPRHDVEKAYPEVRHVAGFDIELVPIVLGDGEPLRLIATTKSGKPSVLFDILLEYSGKAETSRTKKDGGIIFAPMVGYPRSGTTLLAHFLFSMEPVLGYDLYPYELDFGKKFVREWLSDAQPWSMGDAERKRWHHAYGGKLVSGDNFVDQNHTTISRLLGGKAAADEGPRRLLEKSADRCREQIEDMYRLVSPRPGARIIAEKIWPGLDVDLLAALFDCRPIFLVRDPRDVMLSARAFTEKQGSYNFDERFTVAEILHRMAERMLSFAKNYDRCAGPKLLVRYEDLVQRPDDIMREVQKFLGVDAAAPSSGAWLEKMHPGHVTAGSSKDSIGRWKKELTSNERELADWILRASLQRFGYE